jgi:hypothetical protein
MFSFNLQVKSNNVSYISGQRLNAHFFRATHVFIKNGSYWSLANKFIGMRGKFYLYQVEQTLTL